VIDWDQLVVEPAFAVFAEGATYTPAAGGGSFQIDCVFDPPFHEVLLGGDERPSVTTRPVLGVRLAQFVSPPLQGDQVLIASVNTTFTVKEVQPDGHGWALLVLMGPTAGT
jgi:hypothetical protein